MFKRIYWVVFEGELLFYVKKPYFKGDYFVKTFEYRENGRIVIKRNLFKVLKTMKASKEWLIYVEAVDLVKEVQDVTKN